MRLKTQILTDRMWRAEWIQGALHVTSESIECVLYLKWLQGRYQQFKFETP